MKNVTKIIDILGKKYENAETALDFNSTFELLVAVILSAQCTDARVNKVTEELFKSYNTPELISQMSLELLEEYIKTCGLYKNKAKNIKETATVITQKYNGIVPDNREELMLLPGVGRKTANVVLSVGFGKPAMAVDTHVFRVANRLGLSNGTDPLKVENDLVKLIPESNLSKAHHWLIHHGRQLCHARKPDCMNCPLAEYCKYYTEQKNSTR